MRTLLRLSLCIFLLTACRQVSAGDPPAAALTPRATPQPGSIALIYAAEMEAGIRLIRQDAQSAVPLAYELPAECAVWSLTGAPGGDLLALELLCSGGPLVQVFDPRSGVTLSPGLELGVDVRFLAWNADGSGLYLKVDSLGDPRVLLADARTGALERPSLPADVYDLAVAPDGSLLYSLTRGVGLGVETYRARADGSQPALWAADSLSLLTYLRWSPDGTGAAFIRMPDTQLPFPQGELWLTSADGAQARMLAVADAGHGFAPAWSPDGNFLAYVERLNPDDPLVSSDPTALHSAVRIIDVNSGAVIAVTPWTNAQAATPVWSPDGARLICPVLLDGKMSLWLYELESARIQPASDQTACCPAWVWE